MDGPTIAKATQKALADGSQVRDVFRRAGGRRRRRQARGDGVGNLVLRYGVDALPAISQQAGGLGIITPI